MLWQYRLWSFQGRDTKFCYKFLSAQILLRCPFGCGLPGQCLLIRAIAKAYLGLKLSVHTFIFLALAISDAIYVFTMVIHKSIKAIFVIDSKLFYIKPIASPLSHVAYTTSMYLTILLAFERYLKICHPNTATKVCTLSNTKKFIFLASFVGFFYSFPRFFQRTWEYDTEDQIYEVKKTAFGKTDNYKKMYLTWSNLVFRMILPTICLIFFNVFTFIKVNFINNDINYFVNSFINRQLCFWP